MSKINVCPACNAEKNGVKSRIAFEHTCELGEKNSKQQLEDTQESDFRPLYKMYQDVVNAFNHFMIKELAANAGKGNRTGKDGWLSKQLDKKFWMSEIYYHAGKLQYALKEDNEVLIKEYSADIANIALMVLDWKFNLLKDVITDECNFNTSHSNA